MDHVVLAGRGAARGLARVGAGRVEARVVDWRARAYPCRAPPPTVTAAELADLRSQVEAVMQHFPFLLSRVLLWRDGSFATHSKSEKDSMTSALKGELRNAGVKGCQLLGEGIPKEWVSLAHLCQLSWADGTCRLLGLSKDDVSSLRNALLLSKVQTFALALSSSYMTASAVAQGMGKRVWHANVVLDFYAVRHLACGG